MLCNIFFNERGTSSIFHLFQQISQSQSLQCNLSSEKKLSQLCPALKPCPAQGSDSGEVPQKSPAVPPHPIKQKQRMAPAQWKKVTCGLKRFWKLWMNMVFWPSWLPIFSWQTHSNLWSLQVTCGHKFEIIKKGIRTHKETFSHIIYCFFKIYKQHMQKLHVFNGPDLFQVEPLSNKNQNESNTTSFHAWVRNVIRCILWCLNWVVASCWRLAAPLCQGLFRSSTYANLIRHGTKLAGILCWLLRGNLQAYSSIRRDGSPDATPAHQQCDALLIGWSVCEKYGVLRLPAPGTVQTAVAGLQYDRIVEASEGANRCKVATCHANAAPMFFLPAVGNALGLFR